MSDANTENKKGNETKKDLVKIPDSNSAEMSKRFAFLLKLVIGLFLISIILILSASYYMQRQIHAVSDSISSNADMTRAINSAIESNTKQLRSELEQLRIQQLEQGNSLARLYQKFPKDNLEWALAETEYLLIIASQRLLLEKDVATAIAAMTAADNRLKDLGDPALIPVREQLAADINALRAVNNVDTSGLAIYLADLIERSDSLPLKAMKPDAAASNGETDQTQVEESQDKSWRDIPAIIWNELKGLVVVKRSGETRQALLLPDQEYFLYQNLRLELENARLAVLRRDTDNLQASVSLLLAWIQEYFDLSNAAVSNIVTTLEKMQTLKLDPKIPDINSSLETLRAFMREENSG